MDALIGLLLLVATIGIFWGVVHLFRKGRRKRGLIYIAGAISAVAVAGFAVGIKNERDARAAGFASYQEQQAAEETEHERLIAEMLDERTANLGDFPDYAAQQRASELGITRFAAYRQLGNADAISAYCLLEDEGWELAHAKDAQIDAGGDEAALTAKAEVDYLALRDQYNAQFGLIDYEVWTLSSVGYWRQYCTGFEKGWVVVNRANLTSVTRKQARQAQAVLKAIYEDQLKNGSVARNAFDPGGAGFVTCKGETFHEMWFVQCQAKGYSLISPLQYYAVAWHQSKDYPLLVALNGKTIRIWDQIANSAQRRVDMAFAPAEYAGPNLPISEVLAEFE